MRCLGRAGRTSCSGFSSAAASTPRARWRRSGRTHRNRSARVSAWRGRDVSDSIWKKELSFSRKPKAPKEEAPVVAPVVAPVDAPVEKQSVWKKDLSLGKKPKEPKAEKAPKAPKPPKGESTSFWKKEISLGKKAQAPSLAEAVPDAPRELTEQREAVWEKEAGQEPKPAKTPIWK